MQSADVNNAYEQLCQRVMSVAQTHRRCVLGEGSGRVIWIVGLSLFALTMAEYFVGLPFYIRAPIIPLAVIALIVLSWRWIVRAMMHGYSVTRAAMLVESRRPELNNKLVSAIEIYPDLKTERPKFDPGLVSALVWHAQESTRGDDFNAVIDRRPARRQLIAAAVVLALWVGAVAIDGAGIGRAFGSMFAAWGDLRQLLEKASGARIVIAQLDQKAYLVGSSVKLNATQEGFHSDEMTVYFKGADDEQWQSQPLSVTSAGAAQQRFDGMKKSIECFFESGRIQSEHVTVNVTERPRIVSLTAETEFPAYARKAKISERSDGNLKDKLYGSSIFLTVEGNKKLASVTVKRSYAPDADKLAVGGTFAKGLFRLENEAWLESKDTFFREYYTIKITDQYGFSNDDFDHRYELIVVKDRDPFLSIGGIPNRSAGQEATILEQNAASIYVRVSGKDDYGIARVTLHYRIESLETNAETGGDKRTRVFEPPMADLQNLGMLRVGETGAKIGDRVVVWAECEDGYDLEPAKGPHKFRTPEYKMAIVSQEEMFGNVVNQDTWSPIWYDDVKRVSRAGREIPPRTSPEAEPAAAVAARLLDAPQMGETINAVDQQLIQDYFGSLNVK